MVQEDGVLFTGAAPGRRHTAGNSRSGDPVKLRWYDGAKEQEKTFTVMGIIDANDFDKELGDTFTTFLIPEQTLAAMANGIHLTDKLVVQTDTEKKRRRSGRN